MAIKSVIKFDMPGDNCAIPGCSTSRATYLICQKMMTSRMWIGEKT